MARVRRAENRAEERDRGGADRAGAALAAHFPLAQGDSLFADAAAAATRSQVRLTEIGALTLLGLLLLTMPVFAVVGRGCQIDVDVARRPTTILLGYWVRDWLMWIIGPIERALVAAKVSPDLFNYLGVVFGAAAGFAFAAGELGLAGWMILLGGASDIFDGRIARARNI